MADKKQVMDVSRPGKVAASATSRPVIVGHGAMIKDPMMKEKGSEAASEIPEADEPIQSPSKVKLTVQPAEEKTTDKPVPDKKEETTEASDPKSDKAEESSTTEESSTEEEKPSESSEEAIVDAVADQAKLSKEDKKKAEEDAAQQEALNKLIQDKTYFIPVGQVQRRRNNRMMLVLVAVLLLAVVGAYLAVDAGVVKTSIKLPVHFFKQKTAEIPAPATTQKSVVSPVTVTSSDTTTTYKNTDLGFRFSYPKSWGDASVSKPAGAVKGNSVMISFSKQPNAKAGLLSTDYQDSGRDGSCYVVLGLFPGTTLASMAAQVKEGDSANNTSTYKMTAHILKNTADTFIYEQFEAGGIQGIGGCLGVSVNGYKSFSSTAKYTGMEFFWGNPSLQSLAVSEYTKYKASPNAYLADSDRQAFITVVSSAAAL